MTASEKILVVDDDKFNVALMRELCENAGYAVVEAHDGSEAIQKAVAETPDLVLLDIMMKGKNGFEVCRELRLREETADLPVIIVTALDDLESKSYGIELGADDYVTKPFRLFELQRRIRTAIDSRRYRRQLLEVEAKLKKLGEMDTPGRVGGFRQLRYGIEYEFKRAQRYEHPLCGILLGLDNYDRTLTDRGQKGVAAMIGSTVAVLQKTLRAVDRIYRVNEDEFILLLPETAGPGARTAIERIRKELKVPPKKRLDPVTITAALISYPHPNINTPRDFLQALNQLFLEARTKEGDCLLGG